jgi:phage repressor protein C with HTH and peptisase S24 domain
MDARKYLDETKALWGLQTDEELAVKLKTKKSNIDSWVKRNSVPSKWKLFIGQNASSTPSDSHETSNFIQVPKLKSSAGKAGIYNYEPDKIILDRSFFPSSVDICKVLILEVDGDSMEPTLRDGDYVLIDKTRLDRVSGIFAIELDGQVLIKRLQFKLDGTVKIISDNNRYDPEIYDPNDSQLQCKIIGKKVLSISR